MSIPGGELLYKRVTRCCASPLNQVSAQFSVIAVVAGVSTALRSAVARARTAGLLSDDCTDRRCSSRTCLVGAVSWTPPWVASSKALSASRHASRTYMTVMCSEVSAFPAGIAKILTRSNTFFHYQNVHL